MTKFKVGDEVLIFNAEDVIEERFLSADCKYMIAGIAGSDLYEDYWISTPKGIHNYRFPKERLVPYYPSKLAKILYG
jgi:hypothetical protein